MRNSILRKDMVLAVVVFMALTVSPTVTSVFSVQEEITHLYEMENAMEPGSGKILIVDDEGDCIEGYDCYTCIREAIDFADGGDEIWVYSGTYYEDLDILDEQIKLVGISQELGKGTDIGKPVIDYEPGTGPFLGVEFFTARGCTLSGFVIRNGIILMFDSFNITISENNIMHGILILGDHLDHWTTHDISDNLANGKPIYYYKNEEGITVPEDAAQVILANCTKFVIQNLNTQGCGVLLGFSSHNEILGNNITNSRHGIDLRYSYNNKIYGNNITNNNKDGISLRYSSNNNTIYGNNITNNNKDGISLFCCSNSMIYGNNITNNGYGISSPWSSNSMIYGNNITNNDWDGIDLCGSSNSMIFGNNIANNGKDGIYLPHYPIHPPINNTIFGNNITNNEEYGIYSGAYENIIYHNNFLGNKKGNAYDEGRNTWDKGGRGNYWDDYTGQDEDGDGIGEEPYKIPGGNNKDRSPLINPYVNFPPNKPIKPSGPRMGKPGEVYTYSAFSTDPNGDQIYYKFDWGDGTCTSWMGRYRSGSMVNATHAWSKPGTYEVKVKAKDVYGSESPWSDPLSVTMPRLFIKNLMGRFLQRIFSLIPME